MPPQFAPSFAAGTVILALAHGDRFHSWWADVNTHIQRVADHDYDEDADIDW